MLLRSTSSEFNRIISLGYGIKSGTHGNASSFFSRQPVQKAYIFGSTARDEDSDESDIDVLVELDKGATLFDHARMSWLLEDLLHRKVDVVSESGLSPYIRPFIHRDRILIYEK